MAGSPDVACPSESPERDVPGGGLVFVVVHGGIRADAEPRAGLLLTGGLVSSGRRPTPCTRTRVGEAHTTAEGIPA